MVAQLETSPVDRINRRLHVVPGLVQVFTSPQRSFFTNVMAQALRSASQGMPVLVVQFLKGGIGQGIDRPVQLGQSLQWVRCDLPRCIETSDLDDQEVQALKEIWQWTQAQVYGGHYDLVVLDELSLAVQLGLIPEAEVLALLDQRPVHVDIILTGPEMPYAVLEVADQITELRRNHSDVLH